MAKTFILEDFTGGRIIKLNRPDKMNAINLEMIKELCDTFKEMESDRNVRCVIVTGNGKYFSAGADIEGLLEIKTAGDARKFATGYQNLFKYISKFPKPTIAAIKGYALGGGLELALSCDLLIASKGTKLGVPEVKLGAIPAGGGASRLPKIVGEKVAKEMLFSGEPLSANRMYELGLVNIITENEDLDSTALNMGEKLSKLPFKAISEMKKLTRHVQFQSLDEGMSMEIEVFEKLWELTDFKEGVASFLEKKPPVFNKD